MNLQPLISSFAKKRVLLIGDPILDLSAYGHALGLSNETPTVVAAEDRIVYSFGGSNLIARNLLELRATVDYVTVLGDDETRSIYQSFTHPRLEAHYHYGAGRRSTIKKRFWVDGYKLLQLDVRDDRDIDEPTIQSLLTVLTPKLKKADVLLIADNRHGVMADAFIPRLLALAQAVQCPIFVDSQVARRPSNHHLYKNVDVMCLNLGEAKALFPAFNATDPVSGLQAIQKMLLAKVIVVKLGAEGSVAWVDGKLLVQPGFKVQPLDPCGAGDAFLAALAVSSGADWTNALTLANCWAGLSTETAGPNPSTLAALEEKLSQVSL